MALFPELLAGGKTFVFRDFGIFTLPNAAFQRASFWRGEIPLWNPLNNCGIPFLAQWNMAALYPPALIYLLLPLVPGLNLFCLAHLFFAGLGMYCLAARWTQNRLAAAIAGVAFTFNGMTLSCLIWTSNLAGLALMPWVILAVESAWTQGGKNLVQAVLVGALQMLTGAAEIILFTWSILLGLWALNLAAQPATRLRVFTRAALTALLVGLLSAVQLLPFFDLLAHSERNSSYSNGAWAVPLWGWASLFVPLFHCYQQPLGVFFQPGQDWISSYYPGVGILILAGLALFLAPQPRVWLLAGLAVLGFWLALGNAGMLYTLLGKILPALGFMRFPVKFMFLFTFAMPVLAAHAIAAMETMARSGRNGASARFVGFMMIMTGGIIGALLWHARVHPFPNEQWPVLWHTGILRLVFVLLIPGLAWWYWTKPVALLGWLLVLLVWADAITAGPSQNPTVDASVYQPGLLARQLQPVPRLGESRAMVLQPVHDLFYHRELDNVRVDYLGRRSSLMGDCNLLDDLPVADGFYPLHIREEQLLFNELSASSPTNFSAPGLADFLAIASISDPGQLLGWQPRPSHLPFYSVGAKPEYASLADTPALLLSPAFDPRKTVYLPPEARAMVQANRVVQARVQTARFGNQHEAFEIEAAAPTLLVLSQTDYHPWRAQVNGQPARIWRANEAFQAVEVPAGSSRVTFDYQDRLFLTGAVISLITLLSCLGVRPWLKP